MYYKTNEWLSDTQSEYDTLLISIYKPYIKVPKRTTGIVSKIQNLVIN